MSRATIAVPCKKVALCFILLLTLLMARGGFISQAQGFGYVFLTGSGGVREHDAHRGARLQVNRLLVGLSHDRQSFQICFTGSATPGVDFRVKGVTLSGSCFTGSCFTGSWGTGNWFYGAEKTYYIVGISDNVTDPKETITATVSAVNWPSSYSLFGNGSVNFTIRGN